MIATIPAFTSSNAAAAGAERDRQPGHILRSQSDAEDGNLRASHEVTNVGTDRSQLAHVAKETKATLEALHVLAYNLTRVMNIMGVQGSWRQ